MQAIIVDKNNLFIETLKGNYKEGVLKVKRGGIPLLGFGSEFEELEFDYEKLIPNQKGVKQAWYRWDGKNCTQLSFTDIQESSTAVDYKNHFIMGEYAKAAILKKPENSLASMMIWLAIIVLAVLVLGTAYVTNNNLKDAAKVFAPLNVSVTQNGKVLDYLVNSIMQNSKQNNYTLGFMENLSAYLSRH